MVSRKSFWAALGLSLALSPWARAQEAGKGLPAFDVGAVLEEIRSGKAEGPARGAGLHEMADPDIDTLIDEVDQKEKNVGRRVEVLSQAALGTPFQWGPLGEGPAGRFDSEPRVCFSKVDCVTFVEQTMAMACSDSLECMQTTLDQIRYDGGVVSFQTRNHFTSADWLPNLIRAGYLKDTTREVAGEDTKTAKKTISKKAWYEAKTEKSLEGEALKGLEKEAQAARVAEFKAAGKEMPDIEVSVDYLPMNKLVAHLDAIPSGAVVTIVREDKPSVPVLVSHQGFFIRRDGKPYFRHANFNKEVVDTPFLEYFYKYFNSGWRVVGLNLAMPQKPRKSS